MEAGQESEQKISLNLSPSSINTFYQSPLLFYLKYIAKVPDDTPVPVCYSLSGNIVHECLEKYAKKEVDRDGAYSHFLIQWEKQNLCSHGDVYGNFLNPSEYVMPISVVEPLPIGSNGEPDVVLSLGSPKSFQFGSLDGI